MSTNIIGFYEELMKIIFQLLSNLFFCRREKIQGGALIMLCGVNWNYEHG